MINVIHDEKNGEYAVWLDANNQSLVLAVHKREKTALKLARKVLIDAIMAIEQKERKL